MRRVLEFLKLTGVLEVTGQQRHHTGAPSEIFQFRRSHLAHEVLEKQYRHWTPEAPSGEHAPTCEAKWGTGTHLEERTPHNKNRKNGKNRSDESSPAPAVALPLRGRDGAEDEDRINEMIADAFSPSDDTLARLVQGL